MSEKGDKDNPFGAPDTGHVWDDDLRDLTNQPPKWWLIGLYASGAWVLGYLLLYPSIPLASTHSKGLMGWTSIKEYKEDKQAIDAVREPYEKRLKDLSAAEILADQDLSAYVARSAKVLFGDNCSACHGAGGQGNPGFPVLADDDWLYGGGVDNIRETITGGRQGMMPAHAATLTAQEIDDVAKHVVALGSGGEYAPGKAVFLKSDCTACHGADAKGNQMMGAANLADAVWRFSGTLEGVKYTITHGVNDPGDKETRNAVMPSFGSAGKLSETDIKKLAVYVHQLGGGK